MAQLIQWEGVTVLPKYDRIMLDDGQNGILYGCAVTHLGANVLQIAAGYMKIAGGLIEVPQTSVNVEVSSSGTLLGQMWIRVDLDSTTPVQIMSEAAASLTDLEQDEDANYDNGVYELQLATYSISETTISDLVVNDNSLTSVQKLNSNLTTFHYRVDGGVRQVSDDGVNWENFSKGITSTGDIRLGEDGYAITKAYTGKPSGSCSYSGTVEGKFSQVTVYAESDRGGWDNTTITYYNKDTKISEETISCGTGVKKTSTVPANTTKISISGSTGDSSSSGACAGFIEIRFIED